MARLVGSDTSQIATSATPANSVFNTTIAAWLYPQTGGGNNPVLYWGSASGTGYGGYASGGGGNIQFLVGGISFGGTYTLSLNTWSHVAMTKGAASSASLVYINGAVNTDISNDPNSASGGVFTVQSNSLVGRIADAALWGVRLTAAEIAALANGFRPHQIRPISLLGYWPCDGLQSPEPDLSGNANNAALTGTAFAPGPPTTLWTPRAPSYMDVVAAGGFTPKFRKTFSSIGTRIGSRQTQMWG